MKKIDFTQLIDSNNFHELFISHLGWNRWRANSRLLPIIIDETEYQFTTIAERSGLQVVVTEVDELPKNSLARKIDNQLRRQAQDYISIYVLRNNPKHHLWIVPLKNVDKRDLVSLEYLDANHADFLFSKIDAIEFNPVDITTIVDVKEAVHRAFYINSEKITKDFYAGFKKQHAAFSKFITGIDDTIETKNNRNKQWYASVMLNRLMFCYFIQKKGFLDGNPNYLSDKLKKCIEERGKDKFFSTFYLRFLRSLFSDGLNNPKHPREFEREFGRIPYLNGGMFDQHQIERDYANINIEDDAFVSLFEFFDKWQWHLDTRVTASGRDINPDVLGYIFEQYINDRAQMGAYYTKEDITEYIGRNTILPFLFDRVARSSKTMEALFAPNGWVWQTLRCSGNRYLFDAVKQGWTPDWRDKIPNEIAVGLDTNAPDLLARRAHWNDRTPEPFALPTEIWRETIERLQRVDTIISKISAGEITSINDFITYNLDIRLFASDLISKSDSGSFIYNFYGALRSVTVLDPTCGSGAFLFAAMNILEPLYYECILRLDEFKTDPKVKIALDEITSKYRSNIHYFIYKSIILRNLYGVDIMHEATEIAKLRLFLKMVAVVDVDYRADNLGLDPLPDIDFNIRCGNTLVGYANVASVSNDHSSDMFAQAEFEDKIKDEMDTVARVFNNFKRLQLTQNSDNHKEFVEAKKNLNRRLTTLNDILNRHLHSATAQAIPYDEWLKSHQPFHWVAEFYQIIQGNGGFDVIIGNPPYVEYVEKKIGYKVDHFKTKESNAIHVLCIERSLQIASINSSLAMIVPLAIVCTKRMVSIQKMLAMGNVWYSNFAWRPAKLFDAVNRDLTVFISNKIGKSRKIFTTSYQKWISENRNVLFNNIRYLSQFIKQPSFWIPKLSMDIENSLLKKILNFDSDISRYQSQIDIPIYFRNTGGLYWKVFTLFRPKFFQNGLPSQSSTESIIKVDNANSSLIWSAVYSSNLFWWWYTIGSDLRHVTNSELYGIKIPIKLALDKNLIRVY